MITYSIANLPPTSCLAHVDMTARIVGTDSTAKTASVAIIAMAASLLVNLTRVQIVCMIASDDQSI